MEKSINIANRIKYLRENEGYTQKELATKLGLKTDTAIANYESGYSIPKDNIKLKMCELFNCSLDYLMCKTDNRYLLNKEDPFGLSELGFNINDYIPPTQKQREQLAELLKIILKDNKKSVTKD